MAMSAPPAVAASSLSIPPPQMPGLRAALDNVSATAISIGHPRPPPVPERYETTTRYIYIRHPHYPIEGNLLLKLFSPDSPTGGLQYGYLLAVCGIITGNRWDGWLEEQIGAESHRIDKASYELIPTGDYFFHLDHSSSGEPYPICPSFGHWRFPHSNLPRGDWKGYSTTPYAATANRQFSASNLSTAVNIRDLSCRISGSTEGTQIAHVIPKSEAAWHAANNMSQYHVDTTRKFDEDLSNMLLLRADLHIDFDKPKFIFIPKSNLAEVPKLVLHLVSPSKEYEYLYHNRAMLELKDIAPEFLFARLAWTIFPLLNGFLTSNLKKRVTVIANDMSMETKWLDMDACQGFFPTSQRARTKKRTRRKSASGNDNLEDGGLGILESFGSRKRRRISSSSMSSVQSQAEREVVGSAGDNVQSQKRHRISSSRSSPLSLSSEPPILYPTRSTSPPSQEHLLPDEQASQDREQDLIQHARPSSSISLPSPPFPYPATPGRRHSNSQSPPAAFRLPTPFTSSTDPNQQPIDDLKATWLQKERALSDAQHTWEEEKNWAKQITKDGTTMNQQEAARLFRFYGSEVRDEDEQEDALMHHKSSTARGITSDGEESVIDWNKDAYIDGGEANSKAHEQVVQGD